MRIMREYVATMPAGMCPTQFVPMYQESHHTSFDVLLQIIATMQIKTKRYEKT